MTADDWTMTSLQGLLHVEDDIEDEFEIDINEQEPAFLKGQSTKNGGEVSPVKIVANPDGSLQVLLIPKMTWSSVTQILLCAVCTCGPLLLIKSAPPCWILCGRCKLRAVDLKASR